MQVRVVPRLASKRAGKIRIPLGSQFLSRGQVADLALGVIGGLFAGFYP